MLSRRFRSPDAGLTLIEVLVSITLMTVVAALTMRFFLGTAAQASRVAEQSWQADNARFAMSQIVQAVQAADSPTSPGSSAGRIVTWTGTELKLYSDISTSNRTATASRATPSLVDLVLSSGTLKETITPPGGSAVTTVLVANVTNATVFTYCATTTDPSSSCSTPTDPTLIAFVQATLTVQHYGFATPETLQSGIAIGGQVS